MTSEMPHPPAIIILATGQDMSRLDNLQRTGYAEPMREFGVNSIEYTQTDIALIPAFYRIYSLKVLAPGIAASHWDGTYRDRLPDTHGRFHISDGTYRFKAVSIAKHLDSPAHPVLG